MAVGRLPIAACLAAAVAVSCSCSAPSSIPADGTSSTAVASTVSEQSSLPTPSTSTALHASGLLVLQRQGGPVEVCVGPVVLTIPPQCDHTVRVAGLDWGALPWRQNQAGVTWAEDVAMWGAYTAGVFSVTSVSRGGAAGEASSTLHAQDSLCPAPSGDPTAPLPPNVDLNSLLASSPGFQGAWVTTAPSGSGTDVLNIATRADRGALERLVRTYYAGPLCIGTVPGPSRADLTSAQATLQQARTELSLVSSAATVSSDGSILTVVVVVRTPEVEQRARSLVRADVASALRFRSVFA